MARVGTDLPLPRGQRYLTLDAWRGVACLFIVVIHATRYAHDGFAAAGRLTKIADLVVSKMSAGVPMFFVISGYCIAATSDSSRRRTGATTAFFSRRFRRIFPPYWAVAALCTLLVVGLTNAGQAELVSDAYGLIPHPSRLGWAQWLGNATLTETWRSHLFGGPSLKIIGPSWTLCYEEQFYFVCGVLLLVAPKRFFTGAIAMTLLTLALAPVWLSRPDSVVQGFFFDGHWLMFAEGIAVYYVLNYARSVRAGAGLFAVLLAVVASLRWLVPAVARNDAWRNLAWESVVSAAFALALILLRPVDTTLASARLLRPLTTCGQMCYSLYLVHWPVTIVMTNIFRRIGLRDATVVFFAITPVTVVVSLAASWLFHVAVERRFLNSPSAPPSTYASR
jgi:peptidoglycan/LPS O-acetylase OafA/YrhL